VAGNSVQRLADATPPPEPRKNTIPPQVRDAEGVVVGLGRRRVARCPKYCFDESAAGGSGHFDEGAS
jgi:hypothetical protein